MDEQNRVTKGYFGLCQAVQVSGSMLSDLDTVSAMSLENVGSVFWRGSEEKRARGAPTFPLTRTEDRIKGPRNKELLT